jgi:hypothetical protein
LGKGLLYAEYAGDEAGGRAGGIIAWRFGQGARVFSAVNCLVRVLGDIAYAGLQIEYIGDARCTC